MTSLRELQREFSASILSGEARCMARWVVDAGIEPAQRLQIYRNNTRAGFLATMQATFQVIARLGGEDWFAQSVREYQRRFPSRSGDLQYAGARYADYLNTAMAGTPFVYFEDMARLEWAYQEVLIAAPSGVLDPAGLNVIDAQEHERLIFTPRSELRLVESFYPLFAIWKANQSDVGGDSAPIQLDQGGGAVLLIRRSDHIELRELAPDTAALLRQFLASVELGSALDSIVSAHPDFDLTHSLKELLAMQTIAAIHLP